MPKAKKKLWQHNEGQRGHTVKVFERTSGSNLYIAVWDSEQEKYRRASLGHKGKDRAIQQAREIVDQRRRSRGAVLPGRLTIGALVDQYVEAKRPLRGPPTASSRQ